LRSSHKDDLILQITLLQVLRLRSGLQEVLLTQQQWRLLPVRRSQLVPQQKQQRQNLLMQKLQSLERLMLRKQREKVQ